MIDLCVKKVDGVWFGVACQDDEVFATNFASDETSAVHGLLMSIPFDVPFEKVEKPLPFAKRAIASLKEVYDGKEVSNSLPLAMQHLSEYTQKVLRVASLIPLGYATSYGSVSKVAGGSPRGVGRVMALNPFAPIIPCHRVVGSDFSLVGYGGGLKMKLEFLRRERRGYTSEKEIPVGNRQLRVFPVEFVLKKVGKR
jgi:O-6-methylguanine DNA methyltransferase